MTDAALESTGVYWWPVYHALAQAGIEVCVCNAAHMRNVPGRKRDVTDCQWIAELHEYGLLRASFIPDAQVAALRQRTRYRRSSSSSAPARASGCRDAGGRRDQDRLGGQQLLIKSAADDRGADLRGAGPGPAGGPGRGGPRRDRGAADRLDGRFTAGHGQMSATPGCLRPADRPDRRAGHAGRRGGRAVRRADRPAVTIPGVGQRTAEVIVAETGGDMTRFATAARLAAWAGLAPGDNNIGSSRIRARAGPRSPAAVPSWRVGVW